MDGEKVGEEEEEEMKKLENIIMNRKQWQNYLFYRLKVSSSSTRFIDIPSSH